MISGFGRQAGDGHVAGHCKYNTPRHVRRRGMPIVKGVCAVLHSPPFVSGAALLAILIGPRSKDAPFHRYVLSRHFSVETAGIPAFYSNVGYTRALGGSVSGGLWYASILSMSASLREFTSPHEFASGESLLSSLEEW